MPWQLIYTSAPRGLLSGQSGFCTVARSGDLREALAQRLEQISSYHYLRVAEAAVASRNPTVSAFRILDLRGTKYHVLTRIQPCGLDFTARTNHLAHHLVFQQGELAQLPSPATILQFWGGWLGSWHGEPRLVDDPSLPDIRASAKPCLPAQTWQQMTGDAGRAAGLLESEYVRGCYLVCPPESEQKVLAMFCETLQLLNINGQFPLRPWRHTFTTFLQGEDNPSDFQWRACQEDTPAHQQALKRSAALIPLAAVRVPGNSLVKAARGEQKPAAPAPAAAPPESKLTLQRSAARKSWPVSTELYAPAAPRRAPTGKSARGLTIPVSSASLAAIGVFVVLLLGLLAMRHWLARRHAEHPVLTPVEAAPKPAVAPVQNVRTENPPAPLGELDPARLDFLTANGPVYIFARADLTAFTFPIDSISRLQNLIHRFDRYETRPADMRLFLNTDAWDAPPGAAMTVAGRQLQLLSARTDQGLECTFDYANGMGDHNNSLAVRASFGAMPRSFSVCFSYNNGEPFRLLFVNESNPPAPVRLSSRWLRPDGGSLATSFQPGLGERLFASVILPRDWNWKLEPFVCAREAPRTNYLYKDWPADELPSPGDELDFTAVKRRLIARRGPLDGKAAALAKTLEAKTKAAGFDLPLGTMLQLPPGKLDSLAAFAGQPGPSDFVRYLNRLKKEAAIENWPRVAEDDDPGELEGKFQHIYDLCAQKNADAKSRLTMGNTNYFSAVWQNLKDIGKLQQDSQRLQAGIGQLQARIQQVPDRLDEAAYVGLFMIDPPAPGLEMIRFERP